LNFITGEVILLMNITFKIIIVFFCFLSLYNCSKEPRVVATVGRKIVTDEEMLYSLRNNYPDRNKFCDIDINKKREVLDKLIFLKLKVNDALDSNFYNYSEEFYKDINSKKREMRILKYKEIFIVNNYISDNDVYEYIDRLGTEIKVSIILIGYKGAKRMVKRSKEDAEILASFIAKEARKGADFIYLVKNYSDDLSTREKDGSMGYCLLSKFDGALHDIIWQMDVGEISDPIEGERGFYIVRIEDKRKREVYFPRKDIHNFMKYKMELFKKKYAKKTKKRLDELYKELLERYLFQLKEENIEKAVDTLRYKYDRNQFNKEGFTEAEKGIVLAEWEGGNITLGDVMELEQRGYSFSLRFKRFLDDYRLRIYVLNLAKNNIMEMDAKKIGVDEDKYIKDVVNRYYEIRLARLSDFCQVKNKIKIDEPELIDHYNKNKELFRDSENGVLPFKKVRGKIYKKIKDKKTDERVKVYEQELRGRYNVEVNEKILASL
jgi:hypothetical protein